MDCISILLVLATAPCLFCIELNQPPVMVVKPGETFTIACKITGYSASGGGYTNWIRHSSGKPMEWIGWFYTSSSNGVKDSLKNKISFSSESSSNAVILTGQNFNTEDTAVYYCAREERLAGACFDYWGKGTAVTVTSGQTTAPKSIFGLSQCSSDSGYLTIGCVTRGFSPADSLTVTWKDPAKKELTDIVQYPAFGSDGDYTKISHLRVKIKEWNPQTSYTCEASNSQGTLKAIVPRPVLPPDQPATVYLTVPTKTELNNGTATFLCLAQQFSPKTYLFKWFKGENQVTNEINTYDASEKNGSVTLYSATSILQISAEEWKTGAKVKCEFEHKMGKQEREAEYTAKLTLTLKPPIESEVFVNNTVVLQAVVSGDEKKVKEASVLCEVKKENVKLEPGNVIFSQGISQYIKTHRFTVDTNTWFNGETVTCTVRDRDIRQEIHCNKGDEKTPNVTIYRPDSNKDTDHVSLVCEVTSPKLGDVYIMWKVGEKSIDATTSVPIHRKSSTSVLSILTMSKQEYEDPRTTITCAVKHAKKGNISAPLQVSTSQREPPEPEKGFALNCNKDVLEEDEFRSLWSTATSFIFLFLFSLTYSAVLSLLRLKQ